MTERTPLSQELLDCYCKTTKALTRIPTITSRLDNEMVMLDGKSKGYPENILRIAMTVQCLTEKALPILEIRRGKLEGEIYAGLTKSTQSEALKILDHVKKKSLPRGVYEQTLISLASRHIRNPTESKPAIRIKKTEIITKPKELVGNKAHAVLARGKKIILSILQRILKGHNSNIIKETVNKTIERDQLGDETNSLVNEVALARVNDLRKKSTITKFSNSFEEDPSSSYSYNKIAHYLGYKSVSGPLIQRIHDAAVKAQVREINEKRAKFTKEEARKIMSILPIKKISPREKPAENGAPVSKITQPAEQTFIAQEQATTTAPAVVPADSVSGFKKAERLSTKAPSEVPEITIFTRPNLPKETATRDSPLTEEEIFIICRKLAHWDTADRLMLTKAGIDLRPIYQDESEELKRLMNRTRGSLEKRNKSLTVFPEATIDLLCSKLAVFAENQQVFLQLNNGSAVKILLNCFDLQALQLNLLEKILRTEIPPVDPKKHTEAYHQ